MRERWVVLLVLLTAALVVAFAVAFALLQNPVSPPPREDAMAPSAVADSDARARIGRGRAVFEAQGCQRCHAVAGRGNPRSPVDGVGGRRDAAALRAWTLAAPEIADRLPARARVSKEDYRVLPEQDLQDLLAYLQSLH